MGSVNRDSTRFSSDENFILSLFALYYKLLCAVLNIFSKEIISINTKRLNNIHVKHLYDDNGEMKLMIKCYLCLIKKFSELSNLFLHFLWEIASGIILQATINLYLTLLGNTNRVTIYLKLFSYKAFAH